MYHAMEYLHNDYLQQGHVQMATGVLEGINNVVDETLLNHSFHDSTSLFYLNLQYRMHARQAYETHDWSKAIMAWGSSIPKPLVSAEMSDGDFFWASLSE